MGDIDSKRSSNLLDICRQRVTCVFSNMYHECSKKRTYISCMEFLEGNQRNIFFTNQSSQILGCQSSHNDLSDI